MNFTDHTSGLAGVCAGVVHLDTKVTQQFVQSFDHGLHALDAGPWITTFSVFGSPSVADLQMINIGGDEARERGDIAALKRAEVFAQRLGQAVENENHPSLSPPSAMLGVNCFCNRNRSFHAGLSCKGRCHGLARE